MQSITHLKCSADACLCTTFACIYWQVLLGQGAIPENAANIKYSVQLAN